MSQITGYGTPTDRTVGSIGDIYTNTSTGFDYNASPYTKSKATRLPDITLGFELYRAPDLVPETSVILT